MHCSPPGSSVHQILQGKHTGVGCHCLLQGIFPNQGSKPDIPHCRQILYHLSHQGSPRYLHVNTLTDCLPVLHFYAQLGRIFIPQHLGHPMFYHITLPTRQRAKACLPMSTHTDHVTIFHSRSVLALYCCIMTSSTHVLKGTSASFPTVCRHAVV